MHYMPPAENNPLLIGIPGAVVLSSARTRPFRLMLLFAFARDGRYNPAKVGSERVAMKRVLNWALHGHLQRTDPSHCGVRCLEMAYQRHAMAQALAPKVACGLPGGACVWALDVRAAPTPFFVPAHSPEEPRPGCVHDQPCPAQPSTVLGTLCSRHNWSYSPHGKEVGVR